MSAAWADHTRNRTANSTLHDVSQSISFRNWLTHKERKDYFFSFENSFLNMNATAEVPSTNRLGASRIQIRSGSKASFVVPGLGVQLLCEITASVWFGV